MGEGGEKNVELAIGEQALVCLWQIEFRIGKSFNIEGSGLEILSFRLLDFLISSFSHSPVPRFSPSNIDGLVKRRHSGESRSPDLV